MLNQTIYLDHAATSPVSTEVAEQLVRDLQDLGWNAGTRYTLGLQARKALDACRQQIAHYLRCEADSVVFTSGGTESNNLGLHACCRQFPSGGLLWNAVTTHPSLAKPVAELNEDWQIVPLPLTAWGAIDTTQLADLLTPDVVVLEWVNNEAGFVQPVAEIVAAAQARNENVCVLVDGAQGFGKLPPPELAPRTVLTFSGHKIGAPVGVGGVVLSSALKRAPLAYGGGQEHGWRSGTVPVPLIRSLGKALERVVACENATFSFPAFDVGAFPTLVRAQEGAWSPYITLLDVAPVEGEVLQHHLEEAGIFLGTGSACSSARKSLSPIHKALGMDAKASRCTIRWSSAPGQSTEELETAWRQLVEQWRELKRFFDS